MFARAEEDRARKRAEPVQAIVVDPHHAVDEQLRPVIAAERERDALADGRDDVAHPARGECVAFRRTHGGVGAIGQRLLRKAAAGDAFVDRILGPRGTGDRDEAAKARQRRALGDVVVLRRQPSGRDVNGVRRFDRLHRPPVQAFVDIDIDHRTVLQHVGVRSGVRIDPHTGIRNKQHARGRVVVRHGTEARSGVPWLGVVVGILERFRPHCRIAARQRGVS